MSKDFNTIERGVSSFCDDVLEYLRETLPPELIAAALDWRDSLTSDEALQHARRQFADEVDQFIRRLPRQTSDGRDRPNVTKEPVHVAALTMDRIDSLRKFLKAKPPKRADGTISELLEAWAIGEWREWFSHEWEAAYGQRPWASAG